MCGIVAVFDPDGTNLADAAEAGERMLARIVHRGPDETGRQAVGGFAWLGHARLSIVDLDGGRQPLRDSAEGFLVCNGEIYNHERIRGGLGAEAFSTESDNEAALALLRERGPAALSGLHGMWALCAATGDGGFTAARDRIGIKPLYWARVGDIVYFASELRAFDASVQPMVETFPPGCYWTPTTGLVRFADPVPRRVPGAWDGVPPEAVERATREVLSDSVRRHLMADVEVGVFLSGGLDSSLVAAVAAREVAEAGGRLKTFAVGTAGSADLLAARDAAGWLGTDHYEAVFDRADALAVLDRVVASVESFDASLIRSAVPNWFLSELAARHVKVVLTGEGSDELFAGYGYYHKDVSPEDLEEELDATLRSLHGLNLQRCDRVTMAHGLEARVPFLDLEVITHAVSLPPELKALDADGVEKAHLRRAFAGRLPDRLLWRRKAQFGTGSGAKDALAGVWDRRAGDGDPAAVSAATGTELRNHEELAYYRAFRRALPAVRPEAVLTRFATV